MGSSHWVLVSSGGSVARSSTAVPAGACFELSYDGVDDDDRAALGEAFQTVCGVLRDPGFRAFVQSQSTWFSDSSRRCRLVEPAEVVARLLDRGAPQLHIVVNWQGANSALATTNPCLTDSRAEGGVYSFMSIGPRRTGMWTSCHAQDRALLVNTIAHELTHSVPNGVTCTVGAGFGEGEPNQVAYRDGGNDGCSVPLLVSYQFGDLAEAWYRSQGANDRLAFATDYFEHHVNSVEHPEGRRSIVAGCREAYRANRPEEQRCYELLAATPGAGPTGSVGSAGYRLTLASRASLIGQ